jgi:competence protein ComEC
LAKRRGRTLCRGNAAGGIAAAGFAYSGWRAQERLDVELAAEDEGRDIELVGVVSGLPAAMERGLRFEFAVEEVVTAAWRCRRAFPSPGMRPTPRSPRANAGRSTCACVVRTAPSIPVASISKRWLFERNLRAGGYVRERPAPRRLATMVWSAHTALDRARDELRARLRARVAEQRFGGVLIALVLGDQRAIAESDWILFNRTGVSHLVSISGLHITMISGLVALLAGSLWRRSPRTLALAPAQTSAAVAAVIAAFLYCLLAGWGVPAQRTFFMLATVAAAAWLRMGTRPATTLTLAAVVVCLLDPWSVVAPGFWLSFGAVAAILMTVSGRGRCSRASTGARASAKRGGSRLR